MRLQVKSYFMGFLCRAERYGLQEVVYNFCIGIKKEGEFLRPPVGLLLPTFHVHVPIPSDEVKNFVQLLRVQRTCHFV